MSLNRSLLSQITYDLEKKKKPSKPKVPRNQWQHPGEITKVNSPNITMDGVSYPVLGVPNVGPPQMMYPDEQYNYPGADNVTEYPHMGNGGYTVTRSHDRKGKTHKVTGPDGTVKYFGDSKLGQHPSDPARKKAFYARHKKNLDGNPYFRAFARATWQQGGDTNDMQSSLSRMNMTPSFPTMDQLQAVAGFIPGLETVMDVKDIAVGALTGDYAQMQRGKLGLTLPVSGKTLMAGMDMASPGLGGKIDEVANMSKADYVKLFKRYGYGGYDQWVKAGRPQLKQGGSTYSGGVWFQEGGEAEARRRRIDRANKAQANQFRSAEDFAKSTSAIADKLRFSDEHNWFDDSVLNPIPYFGEMASDLGRIPLNIKRGNYGQIARDLATPVAAGYGERVAGKLADIAWDYVPKSRAKDLATAAYHYIGDTRTINQIKKAHKNAPQYFKNPEVVNRLNQQKIQANMTELPSLSFNRTPTVRGSHFDPYTNNVAIDIPELRDAKRLGYSLNGQSVYDHEMGHWIQRELGETYNRTDQMNILMNTGQLYQAGPAIERTPIDRELSRMTSLGADEFYHPKADPKRARANQDYFLLGHSDRVTQSKEPLPFLREMRSDMVKKGYLDNVLDKPAKTTIWDYMQDNPKNRIASFMGGNPEAPAKLAELMGKLPSAAPVFGAGVAASQLMNQKKQGGQTRDEREMVNGIADILSQVNDPQNRAQIAQQMIKDFKDEDVTFDYDKFIEMSKLKNGGMIKRADGSYSKRGLWDNIRANKGSGKKPTPEMLEQERKIKGEMKKGGSTYSGGVWFDQGGQIMYQHGGEFVDLQKQYGVDPLSKVGIEKAKELAAKDPSIRFVCNASGCAQIAADAADAYGQDFSRGNAWDMGNLNNVNYLNPKYKPFMGKAEPLPDPKSYNTGNDFISAEMQIVGLNRTNNVRSNENKKLTNTPKNIKAAAAATKDLANDSFDYANRALYPDTRGYEHVGFNLGSGQLLHGTGANTEHPAFYTIDNMKDGISLPGYGKYDPVETFGPSNMWQKAMNAIGMRKKGGSTYSGNVWFQNGGNPFFPVVTEQDTSLEALNAQIPGGEQTEQQPAAAAIFGQQLQDRVAKDNPAFTSKATFNSKLGAVNNVLAKGMAGNPVLGAIGNVIDGINNQKDYNAAQDKQKQNYSTDYAYGTTYNSPMDKGQYDMYGTMMPNQIGGNFSFTGMNQKYSYAEGGDNTMETSALSWIPKDLGPVGRPFIDAAPMAAAPAGKPAEAKDALNLRFNLDGNFQDYAEKAQKFLDKKSPGSDISGVDLAGAAQAAYQKTGKLVPVELALAQLQIEGYLAQGSKPNKPQRTKNPFNVGNTDSGAVVKHDTAASGIKAYYDLMTTQYLKNKSPEELLVNFTNSNGNRYATDRSYEKKLKDTIGSMKFQQGGEMELTEQEINYIRAMGGEVEFL